MAKATPYLHFNGNCAEAFTFYQQCLGGGLEMDKVGDTPMKDQMPTEFHDQILHASLTAGDLVVMGSDMIDTEHPAAAGSTLSIAITADDAAELRTLYMALLAGGTVGHELKEEFFGTYGDLTDKFGINWMFQSEATPAGDVRAAEN